MSLSRPRPDYSYSGLLHEHRFDQIIHFKIKGYSVLRTSYDVTSIFDGWTEVFLDPYFSYFLRLTPLLFS